LLRPVPRSARATFPRPAPTITHSCGTTPPGAPSICTRPAFSTQSPLAQQTQARSDTVGYRMVRSNTLSCGPAPPQALSTSIPRGPAIRQPRPHPAVLKPVAAHSPATTTPCLGPEALQVLSPSIPPAYPIRASTPSRVAVPPAPPRTKVATPTPSFGPVTR